MPREHTNPQVMALRESWVYPARQVGVVSPMAGHTMTGRCGSCAHWQNPWDDQGESWLVPEDDLPRWGTCALITLAESAGAASKGSMTLPAFTKDGSDYKADLHTRADFGCVLFAVQVTP